MKMRLGYDTTEEILDVFPVLEKYPIKNVAIHARIGTVVQRRCPFIFSSLC
jgi:tRNA-dihydrouridine synthase